MCHNREDMKTGESMGEGDTSPLHILFKGTGSGNGSDSGIWLQSVKVHLQWITASCKNPFWTISHSLQTVPPDSRLGIFPIHIPSDLYRAESCFSVFPFSVQPHVPTPYEQSTRKNSAFCLSIPLALSRSGNLMMCNSGFYRASPFVYAKVRGK